MNTVLAITAFAAVIAYSASACAFTRTCPDDMPETPAIEEHVEHDDIIGGIYRFDEVFEIGRSLFRAKWNICDGVCRPATTGGGDPRQPDQPLFLRTSAPEANSCEGCHNTPRTGGAGDFVANVFVLAQNLDPVTFSVAPEFSNERNTLGMFGAGAIEMLAREMTADLQAQIATLPDGTHVLHTKGVEFAVTLDGGKVISSEGVDADLIIRPFHQSGKVVSLREFTVNAFNHHHGMQAEERFDLNPAKNLDPDHDKDGVERELTVGDITAAVIFQAALEVPGRMLPATPQARAEIEIGEQIFTDIGCATCHVPRMVLNSRMFIEPNPYNPEGTFRETDPSKTYRFDMTRQGPAPRLQPLPGGKAVVRAYTDLKRHNLCDLDIRHFCNEQLAQGRDDQNGLPGAEFFITRKLWDVGNSAPYGHRGDLSTLTEAINAHGGEGRSSRDAFAARSIDDQRAVIRFLKSLQVLPARPAMANAASPMP